jgi:hypothetical protein
MVLPGFITCMDAVHFAYDLAPFAARHLIIGKEGYPTVGINMHCNAIGWVKDVGSIFPGTHNDKTAVRFDALAQAMRKDPLFTQRKWDTAVPSYYESPVNAPQPSTQRTLPTQTQPFSNDWPLTIAASVRLHQLFPSEEINTHRYRHTSTRTSALPLTSGPGYSSDIDIFVLSSVH